MNTPELKAGKRLINTNTNDSNDTTNKEGVFIPESTGDELIFNWDSEYKQDNMKRFKEQTSQQLQFLDQMFNDNGRKTNGLIQDAHDWDGKRIINNSHDKQWFKDYVALVFSIGCIFNATDQLKLNEILKLFENSGNIGFLMNYHKVMNYEDELIKAIEQKMEIGNGNYHLCLITIVQTQDPKILEDAPEEKYKYSGTIEKFCEWKDIYSYMKEIVARYGLLTPMEPVRIHKTASEKATWEIGNEGLATKTARHTEVESNFDIDIDPDDENQIMLYKDLEFKHEQDEHFKPRIREVLRARASENDNPQRMRNIYNKSLYTRIAESNDVMIQHDSRTDEHKGVQLRMNESKQPPAKRMPEYQLYEDDSTYQDGKNVMKYSSDQSSRQYIPTIQHTPYNTQRAVNHSRAITTNALNTIRMPVNGSGVKNY